MRPLLPGLQTRCRQPERMDLPGLDEAAHRHALRGLERVNRFSRSSDILWPSIRNIAGDISRRPLRILDVASGAGDLAISLWQRAVRRGLDVRIEGCDVSPVAVDHARENAMARGADVMFYQLDALHETLPRDIDVITCSLFLHHLADHEAVGLLYEMTQAVKGLILINDLIRSPVGYVWAYFGTRLLSRSNVVHVDGPLSVARAFSLHEAIALAVRAGMPDATVSKHWPQRFLLSWRRR